MTRIADAFFAVYWPVARAVSRVWHSTHNPVRHRLPPGPPIAEDDPLWGIVGDIERHEADDQAASDRHEGVARV